MMQKVKEYMNGSMEPEPVEKKQPQTMDLEAASKLFNIFGILTICIGLVLIPAIGFRGTLFLFGITFVGLSMLFKSQTQILKKLDQQPIPQPQKNEVVEMGEME